MNTRIVATSTLVVLIGMLALILSGCTGFFNQRPTAVIDCEATIVAGNWADFDGTKSDDKDGEIVEYSWDFGPAGTFGRGLTLDISSRPSAFYPEAGTYNVSLTVKDDKGATSAQGFILEVLPREEMNPGFYDPELGVYLWAEDMETGEKITGTTGIFPGVNKHAQASLDLPLGTAVDIYVVADDPDSTTARMLALFPKGIIDWPNVCFARTQGISRVRASVQYPDGSEVVLDTKNLNFNLSEPIFRVRLLDLGIHYIFIEAWDDNFPSSYSWVKIYIEAKSKPHCS